MPWQDHVRFRDRVAFGQGPFVEGPVWTDITKPDGSWRNAVRPGGSFASGRQFRRGDAEATVASVPLSNRDGRYTPYRNGSPFYPLTEACPYERAAEYPVGSGTWYPIWGGVVADVEAGFEGAADGVATLIAQQRLATLAQTRLRAVSVGQTLAAQPDHFWPLNDIEGSLWAEPLTAGSPRLVPRQFSTGGVYDFGARQAPGEKISTRLAFTPSLRSSGWLFEGRDLPTVTATEATLSMVVALDEQWEPEFSPFGELQTRHLCQLVQFNPFTSISVWVRPHPRFTFGFDATIEAPSTSAPERSNLFYAPAEPYLDDQDHAFGLSMWLRSGRLNISLFVDGVQRGTVEFTDYPWFTNLSFDAVFVGGRAYGLSSGESPGLWTGAIANVALWNHRDDGLHQLAADSAVAYSADTADVRFRRLTQAAGIPPEWVDTRGDFSRLIAPQSALDRPLIDLLRELETAEGGRLTVDHQGRLVLASSSAYYTPTRTLTVSARDHATLPGRLRVDNDNLVNDWRGSRPGGNTLTYRAPQAVRDSQGDSQVTAGELPLTTDDDVIGLGHLAVETSAVPRLRMDGLAISLTKAISKGIAVDLLQLAEGDKVIVTDLPSTAPVRAFTGFVERITKDFGSDDVLFTLVLSEWIETAAFDDVRFGEDPGSITLQSAVDETETALVAVTAAGSPPLSDDPAELPYQLVIDGEYVTVTAVSGPVSPQTLTVIRAVSPSYPSTHDAGAVISVDCEGVFGL